MANKCKQQMKLFPFQRMSCLTWNTLLSHLKFFYLWYYLIYSSGVCGVSTKVDVIPGNAMEGHELEDGLLEKGKWRGPHGMRAIVRTWHWCDKGLLVEKGSNLFCSDGCKLVVGESWCFEVLNPIDEGHNLNEACQICFSFLKCPFFRRLANLCNPVIMYMLVCNQSNCATSVTTLVAELLHKIP